MPLKMLGQLSLFFLILLSSCTHLFYQPDSKVYIKPSDLNLEFEEYHWKTPDNVFLHALHLRSQIRPSKGLILQFHGNAENLSSHFMGLAWVVAKGYDLISFDYRGYGRSGGEPSTKGIHLDSLTALEKSLEIVKMRNIPKFIVYGQSLGGAISMRGVFDFPKRNEIDLIVMESTFSSYKDIAFDKLTGRWFLMPLSPLAYVLVSDEVAPQSYLDQLDRPLLVIHGDQDHIVPYKFGKEIFDKTPKDIQKKMWTIEGGSHIDAFWIDQGVHRDQFIEYLRSI